MNTRLRTMFIAMRKLRQEIRLAPTTTTGRSFYPTLTFQVGLLHSQVLYSYPETLALLWPGCRTYPGPTFDSRCRLHDMCGLVLCYDPGPYHQFSTIFSPFILRSRSLVPPLVPLHAAWTATKSPDKSPDGSPDHSTVRYHMPSFRSPQHSTASPFNLLWIASSLPCHDRPPAHDGVILRTASS